MELDTIKYIHLNAHVSGSTKLWNTDLWKSFTQYPAGAIYDPIVYNQKIASAVIFYKKMLLRRQRVLLLGSIESALRISGPFSHLFLTSIWMGGVLTNYRKLNTHLRYFGTFLDILNFLESTQFKTINIKRNLTRQPTISKNVGYFLPSAPTYSVFFMKFGLSCILTQTGSEPQFQLTYKKSMRLRNVVAFMERLRNIQQKSFQRYVNVLYFSLYYFKLSLKYNAYLFNLKYSMQQPRFYHLYFMYAFLCNFGASRGLIKQAQHVQQNFYTKNQLYIIYIKLSTYYKLYTTFFKRVGNPRIRIKRQFPSINIALDLRLANMYILNESRHLYLPLISFHKSTDPARGPVYTIPAHLVTKRQIWTYGYYFLGLVLKTQIMDIKQLHLWLSL